MKKVVLFCLLGLFLFLAVGCGRGIPSISDAEYEVYSEQAYYGMIIFAPSYSIEDGVLYLKQGYYAYDSGWTFSPNYKHFDGVLALTEFTVQER